MSSDLKHRLEAYLHLRQALGFPTRVEGRLLNDFVDFVDQHQPNAPLTAQLALDWIHSTTGQLSASTQAGRLSQVRGFLFHLKAYIPSTEVPPFGLLAKVARPNPHLYSPAQIRALLAAARSLGPRDSLRPHTYFTLIGLTASCGLRGGEAIRLDRADVQLDCNPPYLHIRETKFRKSRLVPMHSTTADVLRHYAGECKRRGYSRYCDAFFISEKRTRLHYHVAARTVISLARSLGIRGPAGQKGPSLHGLRHTFAVERLRAWYREGLDPQARLANLSVYMGHTRVEGTYWYLTATPDLLGAAASRFESYCQTGDAL